MTDTAVLIAEADKVLAVPDSLMGGESFIIPIDLFRRMRDELSRLSASPPPIECTSETGITIGIIDAINTMAHLLRTRDLCSEEIHDALRDLRENGLVRIMFKGPPLTPKQQARVEALQAKAPVLIERLQHSIETAVMDNTAAPGTDANHRHAERLDAMTEAKEALSRLSAAPLPEKIAGLIERLMDQRYCGQEPMRAQAAAAIERLEAERAWLAKRSDDLQTHVNAIEAKTIEKCVEAIDYLFAERQGHCPSDDYEDGFSDACAEANNRILALKPSEGKS